MSLEAWGDENPDDDAAERFIDAGWLPPEEVDELRALAEVGRKSGRQSALWLLFGLFLGLLGGGIAVAIISFRSTFC